MAYQININCDMGESFGRWRLGNDDALLPLVPTANIATGFHGGDPVVMRRTVDLAAQVGADIGAHVALPDLMGFGRRYLGVTPDELKDYVTYQLGALAAFARAAGAEVVHVKPHGMLYTMGGQDPDLCRALLTATCEFDPNLIVILGGPEVKRIAAEVGIRTVPETCVDLNYKPDGFPVVERSKQAWDPEVVAEKAIRVAKDKRGTAIDGTELVLDTPTLCIHGDAPNAVDVATIVRQRLQDAGIEIVSLRHVA
jgi:5-oxoprolinase (ATP-hydrolysing) subunit A